jgi:hypothetical protein
MSHSHDVGVALIAHEHVVQVGLPTAAAASIALWTLLIAMVC